MHGHISSGYRLLVVSDSALGWKGNKLAGFEPVVRELDSVAIFFDEIVWLGYKKENTKAPLSIPKSGNVRIVFMPNSGGNWLAKFRILINYPIYLYIIFKNLRGVTHVHSRAPSHPSFLIQFISFVDRNRIYWHKYAGDWSNRKVPFSYAIQRDFLRLISRRNVFATINGKWNGLPNNILSFENPCLYIDEIANASESTLNKSFGGKLNLLFVGNLTRKKGILNLINSLNFISSSHLISELIIVGSGELYEEILSKLPDILNIKVRMIGSLNRQELSEVYQSAHLNILPSESEGFPKVIAEGAAYGCIPIVTDISSLSQYIRNGENGFLISDNSERELARAISAIMVRRDLEVISAKTKEMTSRFSYEYFRERIYREVISLKR